MAHVALEDDGVHISLSLADKVLAFSGSLRVPYTHVLKVLTDPVPDAWFRGIRIGTNLPGVKVAGTFITGEGNIFYDFHNPNKCLTLELQHDRYARIVVEVDSNQSPKQLQQEIRERLGQPEA